VKWLSVKWLSPSSLTGQIALVMTAALLVASAINFGFLWAERSRAGLIEATGPGLVRFVDFAQEIIAKPLPVTDRNVPLGRPQGGGRFIFGPSSTVEIRQLVRNPRMEQRLSRALEDSGVKVKAVQAADRIVERRFGGPGGPGGQGGQFGGQGGPGGPGGQGFAGGGPGGLGGLGGQFGPPPGARFQGQFNPPDGITPAPDASISQPASPDALRPGAGVLRSADGMRLPGAGFGPPGGGVGPRSNRAREVVFSVQFADGRWLNASFFSPLPPGDEIYRLGATTFVAFACVLIAALWIASRLSQPLQDLTQAAAHVGAAGEPQEVAVRGPSDVRQTLKAFNAMSARVSQLLGEKDVMLGALGHDLRTPLSSLRIRLESMEPESERNKAVKTIEETTQLLEAILELARQGRSTEPVQMMDVSILVQDMVEDYAETGAPVTLTSSERAPAACRPLLLRRLLRNLIDNAVTYGGLARVSVVKRDGDLEIHVDDDGPGMTPEALATATRPFVRGDASRSRTTGGAGLGLALADAIAKTHKGDLLLSNRAPHGLSAVVRLPLIAKT
jgi:signal transduction histidine kinase